MRPWFSRSPRSGLELLLPERRSAEDWFVFSVTERIVPELFALIAKVARAPTLVCATEWCVCTQCSPCAGLRSLMWASLLYWGEQPAQDTAPAPPLSQNVPAWVPQSLGSHYPPGLIRVSCAATASQDQPTPAQEGDKRPCHLCLFAQILRRDFS